MHDTYEINQINFHCFKYATNIQTSFTSNRYTGTCRCIQARIIVGTSTWFLYVSQSPWLIFHVLRYSPLKSSFNMYIFGNLYFWCIFNLFCSLCVEYFMYYICTCKCMSVVWITLNLSHCKFIVQSLHACMVLVYN